MRNVDLFDDYLFGRLSASENSEFESRLRNDDAFEKEFKSHKFFIERIEHASIKTDLKKKMNAFHSEEFGKSNVISINQPKHNYWKIAAIAASISLIVFIGGAFIYQSAFSHNNKDYEVMQQEVASWTKGIEDGINISHKKTQKQFVPANIEDTGF